MSKNVLSPVAASNIPRILVLSSALSTSSSSSSSRLQATLESRFSDDFALSFSTYSMLDIQIIDGKVRIFDRLSQSDIADFDLIYFRTYAKFAEIAGGIADYLATQGTPFIDKEVGHYHSQTKLTEYIKLSLHSIAVPNTIFIHHENLKDSYDELTKKLGLPFVFKDIDSNGGRNNHLVRDEQQFDDIVAKYPGMRFVAQQFIANDGDLRVLVFGQEVAMVIGRKGDGSTHMHNTSQGGEAVLLPNDSLSAATSAICVRAASILDRQVAGLDVVNDLQSQKPYIIEVNNSPQISSGPPTEQKILAFGAFLSQYVKVAKTRR